jgi:hypothetical protein
MKSNASDTRHPRLLSKDKRLWSIGTAEPVSGDLSSVVPSAGSAMTKIKAGLETVLSTAAFRQLHFPQHLKSCIVLL